jgi:hypothetical protein
MTPAYRLAHTPTIIFGTLLLAFALAWFALWRAAPDYRVFRTLGIFYTIVGAEQYFQYLGGDNTVWITRSVAVAALIQTAAEAMEIQHHRWTWLFWPIYLFAAIAGSYPSFQYVHDWPILFSEFALAILIVQGFRRPNRRDHLIAGAFAIHFTVRSTLTTPVQRFFGIKNYITIRGWQWQYTTITLCLLGFATLAIFVKDLIRQRQEKQRLAAELEAARAVQQLLVPEVTPTLPGFRIQSVYKPHGEVGGDFFQILPQPDASVLIVIGDVSGKGMPAAMLVSLLVGALHTLAETTQSPAQILAGLNRRVLGRSRGGFTTCLILHVSQSGATTVANAGHLAPWLSANHQEGRELPVENGLPLGLSADAFYAESAFQLAPDDQITLMTDGVVEARTPSGDLFGFDRAAAIAHHPAESIVSAAQSFGQDDDITVLTLSRLTEDRHPVLVA